MGCCKARPTAVGLEPGVLSRKGTQIVHRRLRQMRTLDQSTQVPFVLVELRGEGNREGFVEICGKDEYGVYSALHSWLTNSFHCEELDTSDLGHGRALPFSDRTYKWHGFAMDVSGGGTSSMGLNTMRLVDFMCNKLSWTLGVVNGGNVGQEGQIREQQIIFKAPHPMNLAVPHFMVELRSAGFIEICGGHGQAILEELDHFLQRRFKARRFRGYEAFCDRCYQCEEGVFTERGDKGDNNMGLLTIKLVDFICKGTSWSLVTMNSGNYGKRGNHREQQLVFRLDNHPLGASPHLMVELRAAGFIEVNGDIIDGIYPKLHGWLEQAWGCREVTPSQGSESLCHKKYHWGACDFVDATAHLTSFFHRQGWQLLVCSQGTVKVDEQNDSCEQQMIFRPAETDGTGIAEPLLIMELCMGDGVEELFQEPEKTQLLSNQRIILRSVGDCDDAVRKFRAFAERYLGGNKAENDSLSCQIFMCRGSTENNLGSWTMRICDFMVDHLGWSFVACNLVTLGKFRRLREQQLVFRYDGERPEIPVTKESELFAEERRAEYASLRMPSYWTLPAVSSGQQLQGLQPCSGQEKASLQELLDATFRRVLTRDRIYEHRASVSEEIPYRLELVHAFRSENVPLLYRFQRRRAHYSGGTHFRAKTSDDGELLNARLEEGEALLFHGTSPSSSVSILKGGFALNHAGKSTGSMFGYGIYLAECCSKADEYARDDGGGSFPGLRSLVVCRTLVGSPLIVHEAGDYVQEAKDKGCHCVLGDREARVGTYKELVIFDEAQVLPEYSIIYKRQYDPLKVPRHLRTKAMGSTGRSWLVKLDKGWANLPPQINHKLLTAGKAGEAIVRMKLGVCDYLYDLHNKTQTNLQTLKIREMKPPRMGLLDMRAP